jgi:hypothetical protein
MMRLPGFPTLVFFFIGNVSVCFAADHSEVVAQEPQLNADQVIGEAQRGIDLRTTHSADPLPAGRSNAGNVITGVDVITFSGPSESRASEIERTITALAQLRMAYRTRGDRKLEAEALLLIGNVTPLSVRCRKRSNNTMMPFQCGEI